MAEISEKVNFSFEFNDKELNSIKSAINDINKQMKLFKDIKSSFGLSENIDKELSSLGSLRDSLRKLVEEYNTVGKSYRDSLIGKDSKLASDESLSQLMSRLQDIKTVINDLSSQEIINTDSSYIKRLDNLLNSIDNKAGRIKSKFSEINKESLQGNKTTIDTPKQKTQEDVDYAKQANYLIQQSRYLQQISDKIFDINNMTEEEKVLFGDVSSKVEDLGNYLNKVDSNLDNITLDKLSGSVKQTRLDIERLRGELANLNVYTDVNGNIINTDSIKKDLQTLKDGVSDVSTRFNNAFQTGDYSGIKNANKDLSDLRIKADELNRTIFNLKNKGVDTSAYERELSVINNKLSGIAGTSSAKLKKELLSSLTSVAKKIEGISYSILKKFTNFTHQGIRTTYNLAKSLATKLGNFMSNIFGKVFTNLGNKLRNVFTSSSSGICSSIKRAIGLLGLGTLAKEAIEYSSSIVEAQNVTDNVFKSMSKDIDDFTSNAASKFGLTSLQAKNMIGVFGGILNASHITGTAMNEMSKNLTALSGDIASFYNMPVEDVYSKLQSGLTGNVQAMRSFGVVMTVANLEAYALSKGITQSWKSLDQATQTTLRYNYILEQLSNAQGDFSRTSLSWSNQVRQLTNNFKQLLSILGGALIKVLYPVVTALNQIVMAAINAANALAKVFGFDTVSLGEMFGGSGATPDLGGFSSDLDDVSEGLDKVSDSAENANDNLAPFDKLINITSDSSKKASDSTAGASSGAGGSLIDFDTYYKDVKDVSKLSDKFKKFYDDLYDAITRHDFVGAGKIVGDAITNINDTIYNKLSDPKLYSTIDKISAGLSDFFKGIVESDAIQSAGNVLGSGINLISHAINTFYEDLTKRGVLTKLGSDISGFFNNLSNTVDWYSLGESFTVKLRSVFDIIAGFLADAEPEQYGIDFKNFLSGAISRLFANGGAEEIGKNIAGVLNFAFDFVNGWLGSGVLSLKLGKSLTDTVNTAIETLSVEKFGNAISNVVSNIGTLFGELAKIKLSNLGEKIGEAVNTSIYNDSVYDFTYGVSNFVANLVSQFVSFIKTTDWSSFASQVWHGIANALMNNTDIDVTLGPIDRLLDSIFNNLKRISSVTYDSLKDIFEYLASEEGAKSLDTILTNISDIIINIIQWVSENKETLLSLLESATAILKFCSEHLNLILGVFIAMKGIGIVASIGNIVSGLSKLTPLLGSSSGAIGKLGGVASKAFSGLSSVLGSVISGIGSVATAIGPQGLVIAAVVAMFAGLVYLIVTNWDTIKKQLSDALGFIKDGLSSIWEWLKETVSNIATTIGDFFSNLWTNLTQLVTNIWNSITTFFSNLWGSLTTNLSNIFNSITTTLSNIWNNLSSWFSNTISNIGNWFSNIFNKAKTLFVNILTSITGFFSDIWNNLSSWFSNTISNIGNWFSDIFNKANTLFSNIVTSITGFFSNICGKITSTFTTIVTKVGSFFSDIFSSVSSSLSNLWSTVVSWFSNIPSTISGWLSGLFTTIKNFAGNIVSTISGVLNNILSGVKDIFNWVSSSIKSVVDGISSLAGKVFDSVGSIGKKILDTFKNIKLFDIGKNIIQGLIDGIKSLSGSAVSSVKDIGKSVKDKFCNLFGIHSPSRVFKEYGEFITEGLVIGLNNGKDDTVSSISDLFDGVNNVMGSNNIPMNNLLDFDSFDNDLLDMELRLSDFLKDSKNLVSNTDLGMLQANMLLQPSTKAKEISAISAQNASTGFLSSQLSNISSQLRQTGQSDKNIIVDVYLDAKNKLGRFVLDTVNGQAIKTGNF